MVPKVKSSKEDLADTIPPKKKKKVYNKSVYLMAQL